MLFETKKCKGLNKVTAQCFKTLGPIPSIPAAVALFGFSEDKALKTSASSASGGKVILLGVKTE